MKFVKRITALFLAMVMVMAMGITAFAANTDGTYNITAPSTSHQYEIYQIFTGSLSDSTLSDIKWGTNGTGTTGEKVSDTIIKEFTDLGASATEAQILAVVTKYVTLSNPVSTITNGAVYKAAPGYYLIKDKDSTVTGNDSYTKYIVKVVGDVTISPKSDKPTFEKKIQDINDSTDTTYGNLQDSADYDIGDEVPFTLTATLPSNYADYTSYYMQFVDQMEKGLTFTQDSVKVYVDGEELATTDYSIGSWTPTGGSIDTTNDTDTVKASGFTITITDLKKTTKAAKAGAGKTVVVKYTAKLNENAVLGSTGNVNEAKLVYSNNPNWTGKGEDSPKGETPWDHVIVFTYKVVVNKVQPDEASTKPLAGAEFTLSKVNADNTTTVIKTYTVSKNDDGTTFSFSGLDDGTYVLTETTTPAGFNTISPITFTITASHNGTWETAQRTTILTDLSGADSNTGDGEITFTVEENKAGLSTDVVNQKGSNLPSTGGMGTTVLYVAGIALIVVAGVVVIARKRNA